MSKTDPKNSPRNTGKYKPEHLRKINYCTRLPKWIVDYLKRDPGGAATAIEAALREKHGWAPPDDSQNGGQ